MVITGPVWERLWWHFCCAGFACCISHAKASISLETKYTVLPTKCVVCSGRGNNALGGLLTDCVFPPVICVFPSSSVISVSPERCPESFSKERKLPQQAANAPDERDGSLWARACLGGIGGDSGWAFPGHPAQWNSCVCHGPERENLLGFLKSSVGIGDGLKHLRNVPRNVFAGGCSQTLP